MRSALAFAVIFLATTACSEGDLTRSRAKSLLQEAAKHDILKVPKMRSERVRGNEKLEDIFEPKSQIGVLLSLGLLTAESEEPESENKSSSRGVQKTYTFTPTSKGEKYLTETKLGPFDTLAGAWSFIMATQKIVEVTGILVKGEGERVVEYTWTWSANDIGDAAHLAVKGKTFNSPTKTGKAVIKLYDDGWRVVEN